MTLTNGQAWAGAQAVLNGESRWTTICADFRDCLHLLPDRSIDFVCVDPPYSRTVHESVWSAKRNEMPDVDDFACRTRRVVDLGFEHLKPEVRRAAARQVARLAKRWVAVFSDVESCHLWRLSLQAAGLTYVRTAEWRRVGGAPQFSGDRPASAFECITLAHQKIKGHMQWNGGGKMGAYEFPVVANRLGERGSRVHPTQKPLELMLDLVDDFSDPAQLVLDCFMGSGTTGVAAQRLDRRFIGVELMAEHHETAVARIEADSDGSSLAAARAGQLALFAEGT